MAYIKGEDRMQITLFPEAIDDYISEDNPVRVIDRFVGSLDMRELGFLHTDPSATGRPPYDPRDMLKLYLYGYMNRIRSSRRLETEAGRNLELLWLLRKLKPDFKTIADFRKDNKTAIKQVFKQFTLLCREWGLLGREVIAIDGSKFRAVNSKKNNFSQKKVQRHLKYIDEKINTYLQELNSNDHDEKDIRVPDVAEINRRLEELKNRKDLFLELQDQIEANGGKEISTVDPDARMMAANNNGMDICHNVQIAVDEKHSLVVECDVVSNPADQGQLSNMAKKAKEVLDVEEIKALADKGYYSTKELRECESEGIETYVAKPKNKGSADPDFRLDQFQYDREQDQYTCPAGQILYPSRIREEKGIKYQTYRNYRACKNCELKDRCTKSKGRTVHRNLDQDLLDRIDRRTQENKALYAKRQMMVEHPFGTVKRAWGYSYFLTKGNGSTKTETRLAFLAYDLRRVINILGVKEIMSRLAIA